MSDTLNQKVVVISDAHVSIQNGNVAPFFEMLESLAHFPVDIVFLGDLFDLWVGWRRYQESFHLDFLEWCREQKKTKQIGMVEGNHEFYICRNFGDAFSWCSSGSARHGAIWFEHGDTINYNDRNYLTFRRLCKNPLTCQIFRILPWGPKLVQRVKKRLKSTNLAYKAKMPEAEIMENADKIKAILATQNEYQKIKKLVFGHFHNKRTWTVGPGLELIAMPAWLTSGELGLFEEGQPVKFLHWKELAQELKP